MTFEYEKSPFFLRDSRASEMPARVKIIPCENGETRRGVIFERACVSLSLLFRVVKVALRTCKTMP